MGLLIVAILPAVFAGWRAWKRCLFFLHMMQLEGYKPHQFRSWIQGKLTGTILRGSHGLGLFLLILCYTQRTSPMFVAILLFLWAFVFASFRQYGNQPQKKPIVFTARMRRLSGAVFLISVLAGLAPLFLLGFTNIASLLYCLTAGLWLVDAGAPVWVWLGTHAMRPVETTIQNGFKKQARSRLAQHKDLKVIGITGSYGKTSVKFIVAEILGLRYNVLATPGSYNTPMGICLVINNQLRPGHQILVLEMGARYAGDLAELCNIARPDISIVTEVGIAHLETMGSQKAIAHEKGTLIRRLHSDGVAILNADNAFVRGMANDAPGKVWLVSVDDHPDAHIKASDITYGPEGARFTVTDETGHAHPFQTRLLGKHNILNILLGIAMGRQVGLRLRQMAHAVARLEPVEHRLQLRQQGPITVIDDAFNANPIGARNAVEVLGAFKTGRRLIVTPGMVELGDEQWSENRALGEHMADHTDLVILIGSEQTRPILEGLLTKQYPEQQIQVFESFQEAQDFLKGFLRPGDVVLYENDLPDQYSVGT